MSVAQVACQKGALSNLNPSMNNSNSDTYSIYLLSNLSDILITIYITIICLFTKAMQVLPYDQRLHNLACSL